MYSSSVVMLGLLVYRNVSVDNVAGLGSCMALDRNEFVEAFV